MAKHKLREEKNCLNCGDTVEKTFCPTCGQENKETKESFHYLFFHTIEDLVHYDSGFWKTIKYLLFFPAKLTTEYLAGRRKSFVPPVKLYIFISFITFFLLNLVPPTNIKTEDIIEFNETNEKGNKKVIDSIEKIEIVNKFKTVKQYDSIQKTLPVNKRDNFVERYIQRKFIESSKLITTKDFVEKFFHKLFSNIPKSLFFIMPIFALTLWFFHNKRKWYYFDHGIFTIHYFSMVLLSFTIYALLDSFLINLKLNGLSNLLLFMMFCWWIFYFYRSHSKLYCERKFISRIKATLILFINLFLISFFWVLILFYTFVNVN